MLESSSRPRGWRWIASLVVACLSGCFGEGTLTEESCGAVGIELVELYCGGCHSANLVGEEVRRSAPDGVNFNSPGDVQRHVDKIRELALEDDQMPPFRKLAECNKTNLAQYLTFLEQQECLPACSGRVCGDDGCGGSCGECTDRECSPNGQCIDVICINSCVGRACGDDGCGGTCGECAAGQGCDDAGQCSCAPQCDGRECGPDGCGGVCGECAGAGLCGLDGVCQCVADCAGKLCGDDGCVGTCGLCQLGDGCVGGQCGCVPDCIGRECGPDGCGGSCGSCSGGEVCLTRDGVCAASCSADCVGRVCGDDNCSGSCGGCGATEYCTDPGQCECLPDCVGKACGDDGCGGSCGTCANGQACGSTGSCMCEPDCAGRECGSDGCGGSCGTCAGGAQCSLTGSCGCEPDCAGKQCGDDGCGGSCGSCDLAAPCDQGTCLVGDLSFAADIYPTFQAAGCGDIMCHGGIVPKEGLDASTSDKAYADMVGVTSSQCMNLKIVAPSNPDASYLINKLTGVAMCSGTMMPKAELSLSAGEIQIIRAWIAGGASP